jgi:hypothetical protein
MVQTQSTKNRNYKDNNNYNTSLLYHDQETKNTSNNNDNSNSNNIPIKSNAIYRKSQRSTIDSCRKSLKRNKSQLVQNQKSKISNNQNKTTSNNTTKLIINKLNTNYSEDECEYDRDNEFGQDEESEEEERHETCNSSINLLKSETTKDCDSDSDDSKCGKNVYAQNNLLVPLQRKSGNDSETSIDAAAMENNNGKRYPSLSKCEVNQLTTYTRKTFFRRCKFVNAGVMHAHINIFFDHMMVFDTNERIAKAFHVVKCVKDTLSSRRGYATTQICNKIRGK